jgi:hypothetical protein
MSNSIEVTLTPIGDAGMPTCRMGGGGTIPIVTWQEGFWPKVQLNLGNHDAPVDYLRALADRLASFADEVDLALRPPTGYQAPGVETR